MIRTLASFVAAAVIGASALAFPPLPVAKTPPKTATPDFRGVDQAVATSIKEASPGSFGATGYLGITVKAGAGGKPVVELVQASSPAQKAGIKAGDRILTVDKQSVDTADAFRDRIQACPPDVAVKISLERDHSIVEVTATPTATSRPLRLGPSAYAGVQLGQTKEGEDVRVTEVANNSPAQAAGIKVGDVLHKLEGQDVYRTTALSDLLREKKADDTITLVLHREGKDITVQVKLRNQPGGGGPGGGGGGGGPALTLWKKPTMNVAIIGVEFTDIKHSDKIPAADLEKLFVGSGSLQTLNDYLREVSAGQFHIEGKSSGWVDVGKKRGDYVQGSGVSNKTAVMKDAVDKLVARDKDALKDKDALLFVYAGEEVRGNAGSVYYPHAGILQQTGKSYRYISVPEGGSKLTGVGTLVKPFGNLLGLPDLSARRENIGSVGMGVWCALSDATASGKRLQFGPWAKEKLGWLKPTVIDPNEKQKLVLSPIEGSNRECFKVLIRPDGSEYLLLENRKKTGFDAELPAEGMLIWRVVNDRPLLEESHGVTGPTGPNVFLSSVPYPSPSNNAFTPNTIPSSRSPLGGGLAVHITNIKRLPDGRVSFQIGREYE